MGVGRVWWKAGTGEVSVYRPVEVPFCRETCRGVPLGVQETRAREQRASDSEASECLAALRWWREDRASATQLAGPFEDKFLFEEVEEGALFVAERVGVLFDFFFDLVFDIGDFGLRFVWREGRKVVL